MALPSSPNQISLQDILFEKQDSNTARTNVSLKGLSVDGIDDSDGGDITGTPNGTAPYKISEFWEWSSIPPGPLTSGNMTNGYIAGNYSQPGYSGYTAAGGAGAYGSWSGSTFVYDGETLQLFQLTNIDPPGSTNPRIFLSFYRSGTDQTPFNNVDDWDDLNIYLNQTDNDGSPDLTLTRASASWTSAPPMANWVWGPSSSYAISYYFGDTANNTHHIEII